MPLLEQLLGNNPRDREDYDDFVRRYDQGSPWDGIRDDEVVERYQRVGRQLPPDVYEESARDAFSQLTPQQRRELGEYLQRQSRQQNLDIFDQDGDGRDDRLEDPEYLARATGRMHQKQPDLLGGMLGGMLGGGGGGGTGRRSSGGGGGGGGADMQDMLSSPIAKAALAGIAAMAAQRFLGGNNSGRRGGLF